MVTCFQLNSTHDLKHLLFATSRATQKFANISKNPKVAMVIDNRSNQESDFHQAAAVTAIGVAKEVLGREKARFQRLYLSKHPYLKDFISSPTCALLKGEVETYIDVNRFQNVVKFQVRVISRSLHRL